MSGLSGKLGVEENSVSEQISTRKREATQLLTVSYYPRACGSEPRRYIFCWQPNAWMNSVSTALD